MEYNPQLENYYSRLKEVLEVTGKLTADDLRYCKLLTENESKNYFIQSGVSGSNFLQKCFCKKGKRSTAVGNCYGNCEW
jgi:hypothetical protein